MKNVFKCLVVIAIAIFSLGSCSKIEDENTVDPNIVLKDIEINTTITSSSIELNWKLVVGCSWYQIYIAEHGQELKALTVFQDQINNPIRYTLSNLKAKTLYDIKIDGLDYAYGGKTLATKSLSVLTIP